MSDREHDAEAEGLLDEGDLLEKEYQIAVDYYKATVVQELRKLQQVKSDVEKICSDEDSWLHEKIKLGLLRTVFNMHDGVITGVKGTHHTSLHDSFNKAARLIEEEIISALDAGEFVAEAVALCQKDIDPEYLKKSYLEAFRWKFQRTLRDRLEEQAKERAGIAAEIFIEHHAKNHGWSNPPSLDFVKQRMKNGQKG